MTRRMNGLALSLEQHNAPKEDEGKKADVDYSATPEAKELDSKKDSEKIEKMHDDVDAAEESLESIAVLVTSLEGFNQSGGLDQNGGALLGMLSTAYLERAGIYGERVVPSLESFGGTSRKTEATKLSMEGLKEMAKDIWAKIVAALKKIKEWVMKQFYHYFGQAESLLKRAKELTEKARKTQGSAETTFDDKGLLNAIRINGKAPTLAEITHFAEFSEGAITKLMSQSAADEVGAEKPDAKAIENKISSIAPLKPVEGEAGVHISDEDTAGRSERLPGDKALYVIIPKKIGEGNAAFMRAVSKIEVKLAPYDKKAQSEGSEESLHVLSTTDAGRIGQVLERVLGEIVANRKNVAKVEEDQNKLIARAEKEMAKASDESDTPEAREELRAGQAMIGNVRNFTVRPLNEMIEYTLATARRLLEYGEKSLAQYKKA